MTAASFSTPTSSCCRKQRRLQALPLPLSEELPEEPVVVNYSGSRSLPWVASHLCSELKKRLHGSEIYYEWDFFDYNIRVCINLSFPPPAVIISLTVVRFASQWCSESLQPRFLNEDELEVGICLQTKWVRLRNEGGRGGCSDSLHRWLARCSESLQARDSLQGRLATQVRL